MARDLSIERVRELLSFDPDTGIFRWRVNRNRHAAGTVAGTPGSSGHILIRIDGTNYLSHRLAWLVTHGAWPPDQIDHANGNPADNRLSNLRPCTHAENMQNQKTRSDNALGLTGVTRRSARTFAAEITHNGKRHRLGSFKTAAAASAAYLAKKRQLHEFQPEPRDEA